jgi:hypothetical protein
MKIDIPNFRYNVDVFTYRTTLGMHGDTNIFIIPTNESVNLILHRPFNVIARKYY